MHSPWQVFWIFLRLGLTSFGGPVAHLGYFRDEFVQRRQWLTERSYADLVALCQFLPGPASSQVGMALGLLRSGLPGALAAWLGFTLPSALALTVFGLGLASGTTILSAGALLALFDAFYRVGALVFGGGHVMLPLLQAVVVPPGWVSADTFLAGYGATQAVPGPLFTFAAFLGAAMAPWPGGWLGALVCLGAIFLPSFLLVLGALPFWERLRRNAHAQAALSGVNAAVVGLLLAALVHPVGTSAILSAADAGLALLAFVALVFWRVPPWAVVLASGVGGAILAHMA